LTVKVPFRISTIVIGVRRDNTASFEFNNCPTRCDLFSLLYFCRQLYIFRV